MGSYTLKPAVSGGDSIAFDLLWIGIGLLVLGILFYVLGARGLAGFTAGIGKLLLWIFVVLFVITLIMRFLL